MGRLGVRYRGRAWRSAWAVPGYFAASCLLLAAAAACGAVAGVLALGLRPAAGDYYDHEFLEGDDAVAVMEREDHGAASTTVTDTEKHGIVGRQIPSYQANCTPPSLENFPENVMSIQTLRHGGFLVNLAAVCYMFGVLALVCDSYFMSSLEILCADLKLSEDVAGASFMAIGGSAPELFTSIFGVFIAKGNIGVGTVIGSAVFNILCVIGLCGLLAGKVVYLTRWPLARDFMCYTIAVISLVAVIFDNKIHWWESLVFILLYIGYLVLLFFDPFVRPRIETYSMCYSDHALEEEEEGEPDGGQSEAEVGEQQRIMADKKDQPPSFGTNDDENQDELSSEDESTDEDNPLSPFSAPPSGACRRLLWVLAFPPSLLFYLTVPNCSMKRWRRWYPVTFVVSLAWIGAVTYLLVWMVTILGYVFMLPDTVMGLTLLAAGSSTPDTILSIIAARNGYGDMAICHSVGSNIFDILLGLGLPWFLHSTVVFKGRAVPTNSNGLTIIAALLVLTVVVTLAIIKLSRFRLTKKVGALLLALYIVFLVPAILFETNIIVKGLVPPMCALPY